MANAFLPIPPTMRLRDDDELESNSTAGFIDDEELEAEFPLGDGTADTEASVYCPYCAEEIEIAIDPGGGPAQEYVEDCQVCCQPWRVSVTYLEDGHAEVAVSALDE